MFLYVDLRKRERKDVCKLSRLKPTLYEVDEHKRPHIPATSVKPRDMKYPGYLQGSSQPIEKGACRLNCFTGCQHRMPQQGPQSNVRVVVRVRPENECELQHQPANPSVRVVDDFCLIFDPNDEDDSFIRDNHTNYPRHGPKKKHRDMRFGFDRVFEGNCSQEEVYLGTTRGLVERMMSGINCSVFAYGATGAGKTYTMLGSSEQPGVTFRTVKELFDAIDSKQAEMSCDVKVCLSVWLAIFIF